MTNNTVNNNKNLTHYNAKKLKPYFPEVLKFKTNFFKPHSLAQKKLVKTNFLFKWLSSSVSYAC